MNQRPGITYRKLRGFSLQGIRIWGLLFLLCGAVGYSVFARGLIPSYGDAAPLSMITVGMILQVLTYCAIPIFAFLLVQGFLHTTSIKQYAIRLLILAVIAEVPFNFCMTGHPLGAFANSGFNYADFSLNPVFGTLLSLVVLFFFRQYPGKTTNNIFVKVLVWLMAFLWAGMFRIEYANIMLVLVPVLWLTRRKKAMMIFGGCVATFLTCIFGLGNMGFVGSCIAPLTFLLLHFWNEEQGESNRYINYLAYPVILVGAAVATLLAF